jgi:hypothetical protein
MKINNQLKAGGKKRIIKQGQSGMKKLIEKYDDNLVCA